MELLNWRELMSSQPNDLVHRVIKAQNDIRYLKTSQILGGDNFGFHLYTPQPISGSIAYRGYKNFVILIYSTNNFPLVSVELDLYENGNRVVYPYSNIIPPYGESPSSLMTWNFIEQLSIPNWGYGTEGLKYVGRNYMLDDPRVKIFAIELENNRSNSTKTYRIDNIKVRCTSDAIVFAGEVQESDWI